VVAAAVGSSFFPSRHGHRHTSPVVAADAFRRDGPANISDDPSALAAGVSPSELRTQAYSEGVMQRLKYRSVLKNFLCRSGNFTRCYTYAGSEDLPDRRGCCVWVWLSWYDPARPVGVGWLLFISSTGDQSSLAARLAPPIYRARASLASRGRRPFDLAPVHVLISIDADGADRLRANQQPRKQDQRP
jgi:hypothetical protein